MSDVNKQLFDALKALFASYKQLADSGDAGNWRIEDQSEGRQALQAIAAAEQAQQACQECNGTGSRDSGGVHPWGEAIMVPCDCQSQQQAEPVAWEVTATKGDMPRQTKLLKHEAAAIAAADHWRFVGCNVAVRGLVYAQAYAAQPPAVPDGYALVPIEPTREMFKAVHKLDDEMFAGGCAHGANFEQLWEAAILAAPKP